MKALLIIFAPAIECEVMARLEDAGIKKFTKFPYLHGIGTNSEPHLDTQVWPGSNVALLIAIEGPARNKLIEILKVLKKKELQEGLKVFEIPAEEII